MFSATTDAGFDLLMSFLAYDPKKRITAREALSHRYFTEPPLPREPGMIQTFPSLHEVNQHSHRTRRATVRSR
jgi:cell division cycle 2-like protein